MNTYFENVKKNFGFGCMRLPMEDGEINRDEICHPGASYGSGRRI